MSVKIIGLDLDGTTLNDKGEFSLRTKEAFKQASEMGIQIVVSTGRALHSLPSELYEIEGLAYAITSNGARIIKLETKETIREKFLNGESVRVIHDFLKKCDAMIEIFCDGRAYISAAEFNRIVNMGETRRNRKYVSSTRTPVEDIYAMLWERSEEIENISINYSTLEEKQKMEEDLSLIPNITITSSLPYNNEIGGLTTSKADALEYMLKMFSVNPEELMCCGDSPNDIAMIKLAGIGIAMENAVAEVKEIADYVTDTNDRDGVAKAIEKFAL